ncbi:hypothetical protein BU17DRAFT_84345 [Hysterangium stoloniferum]|nr:hypothetical protein BU17DRAFT_84345 [Hysterangium stoloniferum]
MSSPRASPSGRQQGRNAREHSQPEYPYYISPFEPSQNLSEIAPIKMLYNLMCHLPPTLRAAYFIISIAIYKQEKSKAKHEFIAAEISGPHQSQSTFLVVERTPQETSFSGARRTLCSRNFVAARDTVISLDRPTFDNLIRQRSAKLLQTFSFHRLPSCSAFLAVHFCRLIASISKYREDYVLSSTSCYWFAGMIMATVEEYFPVERKSGSREAAGRYNNMTFFMPDPDAMCSVKANYDARMIDEERLQRLLHKMTRRNGEETLVYQLALSSEERETFLSAEMNT